MEIEQIFQTMVEHSASDLFLKVGACPFLRVDGQLQAVGEQRVNRAELLQFAYDLMGPERQQLFQAQRELNFAFERDRAGRFRANVLWQRSSVALVIRRIQDQVPDFDALHLPAAPLQQLAKERRGLVLIGGPTGSGKSTTAAALLEHINRTMSCHIVTLEDPVEFLFREQRSVINQREVGVDTRSFSEGLKNVLRQSPDVLFISDIRDRETMESALLAAESGQLVLSCIHTTNVLTTIERMLSFFSPHQHQTVRFRLSLVLKGIVCLRLLPRGDHTGGQLPACEVLITTPRIRECLREGQPEQIPPLLHEGAMHGMQTMTQALYQLVRSGAVALEDAAAVAESPEELRLALQEVRSTRDAPGFLSPD